MFEFMADLRPGNGWLEVVRIGDRDARNALRVIPDDELECFDIDLRQGSSLRRSRGVAFRVAHEVLTRWAFRTPRLGRKVRRLADAFDGWPTSLSSSQSSLL